VQFTSSRATGGAGARAAAGLYARGALRGEDEKSGAAAPPAKPACEVAAAYFGIKWIH
jgi:hypothetical protein